MLQECVQQKFLPSHSWALELFFCSVFPLTIFWLINKNRLFDIFLIDLPTYFFSLLYLTIECIITFFSLFSDNLSIMTPMFQLRMQVLRVACANAKPKVAETRTLTNSKYEKLKKSINKACRITKVTIKPTQLKDFC